MGIGFVNMMVCIIFDIFVDSIQYLLVYISFYYYFSYCILINIEFIVLFYMLVEKDKMEIK